ncbi:hypothetical protein B9R42_11480 [Arthrospira platensis PCC 7345]
MDSIPPTSSHYCINGTNFWEQFVIPMFIYPQNNPFAKIRVWGMFAYFEENHIKLADKSLWIKN